MTKKEQCKEIMLRYFGPSNAAQVDNMKEGECVALCRVKVAGFLGEDRAKEFDSIK